MQCCIESNISYQCVVLVAKHCIAVLSKSHNCFYVHSYLITEHIESNEYLTLIYFYYSNVTQT